MTQRSFHWNGASLGDANTLVTNAADGIGFRLANEDYESLFVDRGLRMLYNGDENRGVLKNWGNELAVAGVATPVTVDTGGAIVYGMPYENTVSVNVAVPSPTSDTRQDYIVLRRNWADQEIRITRIAGVEGGGVPALTQSPAPSGTGIYDIPLATLSTTTGGVITVTDAREFCLFGGEPGDDSLGATQLTNSSIDWSDRETRTKRYFLGGGCLEPMTNGGVFWYNGTSSVTTTGIPTWGGGANTEGWQINAATYEGVIGRLSLPFPDYVSGSIASYIWWVPNSAVASTYYIRSVAQAHSFPSVYFDDYINAIATAGYESVYVSGTSVQHELQRTAGFTIPEAYANWSTSLDVEYLAYWYNSAGVEDINILGVEFVYTGYV
jgi:hypothetical protein